MKNKSIKLISVVFAVFTILNTSNAQVKTKIFYKQIPSELLPVSKTIEQRNLVIKALLKIKEFFDWYFYTFCYAKQSRNRGTMFPIYNPIYLFRFYI